MSIWAVTVTITRNAASAVEGRGYFISLELVSRAKELEIRTHDGSRIKK